MPLPGSSLVRRAASPRRAATDRVTTPSKHAARKRAVDEKENDEAKQMAIEVQMWRNHGKSLSEVVRKLQSELEEERLANQRKDRLIRAQEEKIRLLESMCHAQAQFPSLQSSQESQEQSHPKPQQHAWLPSWLALPEDKNESSKSPPPWSKWLAAAAAAGSSSVGGHFAASASDKSAVQAPDPSQVRPQRMAPSSPATPPRRQQARPQGQWFDEEDGKFPGRMPGSLAAAASPLPRTDRADRPDDDSHSNKAVSDATTPQDWAGAQTAARRLNQQWTENSGGGGKPAVSARSVEQFLDSMLSAVAPPSPPKRAPLNPLLEGPGALPTRCSTSSSATPMHSTAFGCGCSSSPEGGAAATQSAISKSEHAQPPMVVALGAALEDHVSLHEPSPPVTTRSRQSDARSRLPGGERRRRSRPRAGSSEATSLTSEATWTSQEL